MKKQFEIYKFVKKPTKLCKKGVSFFYEGMDYPNGHSFVLPNMAAFVRDVTEHGNIGAIKKRVFKLGVGGIVKLGFMNLIRLHKLARQDFASAILMLIQIEALKLSKYKPKVILISDQITDLSVALNNRNILSESMAFLKKYFTGARVGIMTNNLVETGKKVAEWKLKPDIVFSPLNSYGFEMNPSKIEVENYLNMVDTSILGAILVGKGEGKEISYLQKLGVRVALKSWFSL